jgi:hypothetical protein
VSCATRKSACDKKKPSCTRCSTRSLVCLYPPLTPARSAKQTTLPFRKSPKVTKVEGDLTFPGLVPAKRPSLATPQAKEKKSKVARKDGSFGGESGGPVRGGYDAGQDDIEDKEMLA